MSSQQREILDLVAAALAVPDGVAAYDEAGTTYVYDLTPSGAVRWSDEERPLQIDPSASPARLAEVHLFDAAETDTPGAPLGSHTRQLSVSLVGWAAAGSDSPSACYLAAVDLAADIRGALERRGLAWGARVLARSVQIETATGARFGQPGYGVVAGRITVTHRQRPVSL
jgi:hypothetical protein